MKEEKKTITINKENTSKKSWHFQINTALSQRKRRGILKYFTEQIILQFISNLSANSQLQNYV